MLKLELRPQPSKWMSLGSPLLALALTVLLGLGLFVLLGYVVFAAGVFYFIFLGEATATLLRELMHWLRN